MNEENLFNFFLGKENSKCKWIKVREILIFFWNSLKVSVFEIL